MRSPAPSLVAIFVLIGASAESVAAPAAMDVQGLIEARDFLEAYRIADAGETQLSDLYSDKASIHVRVPGQMQAFTFGGQALKAWSRELAKDGHSTHQGSVFQGAKVERRGERLLIHARRYSASYCYWDEDYQVTIAKEGLDARIVDERLTLQPKSRCRIPAQASGTLGAAPTLDLSWRAPPATAAVVPWQPLSQEDITAMALRLARDAVPKSPQLVRAVAVSEAPSSVPSRSPRQPSTVRIDPDTAQP